MHPWFTLPAPPSPVCTCQHVLCGCMSCAVSQNCRRANAFSKRKACCTMNRCAVSLWVCAMGKPCCCLCVQQVTAGCVRKQATCLTHPVWTLLPSMHLGSTKHVFKQAASFGRLPSQATPWTVWGFLCRRLVRFHALPAHHPPHRGQYPHMPAAGIAEVCHRWQVPLIVDEAHGSHFCFHQAFPQVHVHSMYSGCRGQSQQGT